MSYNNNLLYTLKNLFISASGNWAMNENQLSDLINTNLGAIVLKSCTLEPKYSIDDEQINYRIDDIFFNSKNNYNSGFDNTYNLYLKYSCNPDKQIIFSILYENNANLEYMLNFLKEKSCRPMLIEINLCSQDIGYDSKKIALTCILLLKYNSSNLQIGFKLPPYIDSKQFEDISEIINLYDSVKFVVCSSSIPNTLPIINNMYVFPSVVGNLSGKINKYISLNNVRMFRRFLDKKITLIGCGGIRNEKDVYDYINNGASYVQIATGFYNENINKLKYQEINNLILNYFSKISKL